MSNPSEPNGVAHTELEHELAQLRAERRDLAADLAGEDPDDTHGGDFGDAAQSLEGEDELSRRDRRIREIEQEIATHDAPSYPGQLADGTVVTVRFADGDQATLRVVTIPEQADPDDGLTADSPLGRALAGHQPGDTVTYAGPDGELQAELIDLQPPSK